MRIDRISIKNFRSYQDSTDVILDKNKNKNLYVIAGKNGYGKTSFLTALVWAFYGKLFTQVESKYKRDVLKNGGYTNYIKTQFNNSSKAQIEKSGNSELRVEVELSQIAIPSIPCQSVKIIRTYDLKRYKENVKLLIDGKENELTKEVGYDVFINDFILPREIAKFFFFDAEKIVELAEAKTTEELRTLSKAYSEVLGIKKYEDLKYNLETLISNLKRKGISDADRKRLDQLRSEDEELTKILDLNKEHQDELDEKIADLNARKERLQEKLIREGTSITLEELNEIKSELKEYKNKDQAIKSELKKCYELVPFLMAQNKLKEVYDKLAVENQIKKKDQKNEELKNKLQELNSSFKDKVNSVLEDEHNKNKLISWFEEQIETYKSEEDKDGHNGEKILFEFSEQEFREFESFYDYLTGNFKTHLEQLKQQHKEVKYYIGKLSRQVRAYESKGDNHLVKTIRKDKKETSEEIERLQKEKNKLAEDFGNIHAQSNSKRKLISEYENKFNLFEKDLKKYETTQNLIKKINKLIVKIKEEKKYALQDAIKEGLDTLMHKESFISDVKVVIQNEIMDVELYDHQGNPLEKENLSKGEQQLYATALLNALVEESGIQFPVIIDSPLQKIDKEHSENIIRDFYPKLSEQVIVLPLLEKELSKEEFDIMKPNISKSYIIQQDGNKNSRIANCQVEDLFKPENLAAHVHAYQDQ
jgi:DNA sulfur modification protein DndD